jgi:hypothetical protein
VDEEVWLTATKPHRMLYLLRRLHRRLQRPVCERKSRFLALAFCRLAWPAISDERSRRAVEDCEQHLGLISEEQLTAGVEAARLAREEAYAAYTSHTSATSSDSLGRSIAASVAYWAVFRGWDQGLIAKTRDSLAFCGHLAGPKGTQALLATMASHMRDIFGNPFRPATFEREWRTETPVAVARQMYESRDFDAMPILADALQDAGCDNEDVLSHCRGDGPHVRGCWVVDLMLGKA